jgi:hypothetical protein
MNMTRLRRDHVRGVRSPCYVFLKGTDFYNANSIGPKMFSTLDVDIRPGSGLGRFEIGCYEPKCVKYFYVTMDIINRCIVMDRP